VCLACSEPVGFGECSGDVELQVTEGSTPVFNWTPPCAVAGLAVFDGGGNVHWSFHTGIGRNGLEPAVRYGQLPPGAVEEQAPQALRTGFGYIVRVFRFDRDGEEPLVLEAGKASFRH
jgi:hypothetical protein